ncbi:PmoA family protein [Mucilaginibacter sp. Bleaf8]|uniref:DUF6807 domain-containing protein n=1 Tax=Mucilaginibacter sp. Bleaf8 TaxID=2834430 RepID=UPI001BCEE5BE|nr:PmoA family protein [Mucilaginibacter sp. Bleaf8]MBS7564705.1 PmoA family protein [Mucilaginibacter sp. Bleaf8]
MLPAENVTCLVFMMFCSSFAAIAQDEAVDIKRYDKEQKVEVLIGGKPFTTFMYPDSLEKPVLYPLRTAGGKVVTRGFPLDPRPGDPTDHPHHIGLWFNFENVNGLDFWNNSYAIPAAKKSHYGWIRTKNIKEVRSGKSGVLAYTADWTDQAGHVILTETTRFVFSGSKTTRQIDRITTLKAVQVALFKDAKDGLLGLRLAHELQMPTQKDESFSDSKGIVTVVKGGSDQVPTGNYITSEGKTGNDAWSSRAVWCNAFGKIGADSVSVTIIDHPDNPSYPTFWHARGYGLFAANPLGEQIFTNGLSAKNLKLEKGKSVTFKFRILINQGTQTPSKQLLNASAKSFAGMYLSNEQKSK